MSSELYRNMHSTFVINKKLLKELGPDKTCMLHVLANGEPKWTLKQEIETDGWFLFTAEDLKKSLCLNDEEKIALEQKMIEDELIEIRPARGSQDLCYRINWDKVQDIMGRG